MMIEMSRVTIFLHREIHDYADEISTILDTSRSEVVESMIRYVKDNDLEEEVFEGYAEALEEYEGGEES